MIKLIIKLKIITLFLLLYSFSFSQNTDEKILELEHQINLLDSNKEQLQSKF